MVEWPFDPTGQDPPRSFRHPPVKWSIWEQLITFVAMAAAVIGFIAFICWVCGLDKAAGNF